MAKSAQQRAWEQVGKMTRPGKNGLDYICLDVDFAGDEKVVRLEAKEGKEAVYAWTLLLCDLYRVGACYRWDDDALEGFCYKHRWPDSVQVAQWVDTMLDCRLFDREVYEKTGFLTSKGIQRRFLAATTRRKDILKLPEGVALIEVPDTSGKYERKAPGEREGCETYGHYSHVFLTPQEKKSLSIDFGEGVVADKIDWLDGQIENGVRKYTGYKNHAACLRNWCKMDAGKNATKKSAHEKNLEMLREAEEEERRQHETIGN